MKKFFYTVMVLTLVGAIATLTGCDEEAMRRAYKAAKNTKAEEDEAKDVTRKFFAALTSGNATTAKYYLASNSQFDRSKMEEGSQFMAAMGGWDVNVLDATVDGDNATVDIVISLYGQEGKKTCKCILVKEADRWKVYNLD